MYLNVQKKVKIKQIERQLLFTRLPIRQVIFFECVCMYIYKFIMWSHTPNHRSCGQLYRQLYVSNCLSRTSPWNLYLYLGQSLPDYYLYIYLFPASIRLLCRKRDRSMGLPNNPWTPCGDQLGLPRTRPERGSPADAAGDRAGRRSADGHACLLTIYQP